MTVHPPADATDDRSKRISNLVGHQINWKEVGDFGLIPEVSHKLGERRIDPSMAPIKGGGRQRTIETETKTETESGIQSRFKLVLKLLLVPGAALLLWAIRKIIF